MSWSTTKLGTKNEVRKQIEEDLDRCAANYKDQEEEKDVLAAKERALSAIDELNAGPNYNGVQVTANGSRSSYGMTMSVQVQAMQLQLPAS